MLADHCNYRFSPPCSLYSNLSPLFQPPELGAHSPKASWALSPAHCRKPRSSWQGLPSPPCVPGLLSLSYHPATVLRPRSPAAPLHLMPLSSLSWHPYLSLLRCAFHPKDHIMGPSGLLRPQAGSPPTFWVFQAPMQT